MTPDQIRARLAAEGYPPNLLDAYLPGGQADSTSAFSPNVFAAVRKLGIEPPSPIDSVSLLPSAMRRSRVAFSDSATLARADSGFDLFGLDAFQRQTTQFDPNLAGPVPSDYRLGPGDELVLILTGDVEKAYSLPVTREGFVVIPDVGEVPVANLTMQELDALLYAKLGRVYSGVRPGPGATTHFDVSVSRLGTSQVSVLGDVAMPGSYRMSKLSTILGALYAAGGPTRNGDMRNIELRRGGAVVGTLDLYRYLLAGDGSGDLRLQTGDIVFVPPRGPRVRISGAVVRPATYELRPGETLRDLLRMSGGFLPQADRRRLQIDRIVPPSERTAAGRDRMLFDVASASLDSSTEHLYPGDVVHVLEIADRVANRLAVKGNVWSPGLIAFTPGMHLSDALHLAGGLKPDTYLPALQVSRLNSDSTRRIISVTLRDTLGDANPDLALQPNDEIQVFSLTEYRTHRFVAITGAVKKPGQILYREGMTLRQALMLAGGLKENALLTQVEIARMPADRSGGTTAITRKVPIDSSYLFERGASGNYDGPPGVPGLRNGAPEFVLNPYDNVLVLAQPDWAMPRNVTVLGEVRFPGTYTLKSRSDRLSDIIARAGGLTPRAYPQGAVFTRARDSVGRLSLDLPRVLRDSLDMDNVVLADGDSLTIPSFDPVVTVRGAVYSPVSVSYANGADLDYYIRSAGGGTPRADLSKTYVMQPNGRVQTRRRYVYLFTTSPTPEPGSTITVPSKDPNDKHDWLGITTAFTSILGSLVAIAAITRR